MWAAPELLGAPTMGGGRSGTGGGGGEGFRSQISLPSRPKYMKTAKNGGFAHILAYKLPKTPFFPLKYITRCTHEMIFEKYIH